MSNPYILWPSTHNEESPLHIEWQLSYAVDSDGAAITDVAISKVSVELVKGVEFPVTVILQDKPGEKLLIAKYWPELECVMDSILEKCGEDWWDNADLYRSEAESAP